MKRNIGLAFILTLTLFFGVIFVGTIVRALFYVPEREVPLSEAPAAKAHVGTKPVKIAILKLGIDAEVVHVGVSARGNMAVPESYKDVGWYKYGAAPGEQGSAVMAGHMDNGFGLAGVFRRLSELRTDDEIRVRLEDGKELVFRVIGKETYPHAEVPTALIFGRSDMSRLNLITCEGSWINEKKTYDRRLVVFAVLK